MWWHKMIEGEDDEGRVSRKVGDAYLGIYTVVVAPVSIARDIHTSSTAVIMSCSYLLKVR